jgi:hypothetical protein
VLEKGISTKYPDGGKVRKRVWMVMNDRLWKEVVILLDGENSTD